MAQGPNIEPIGSLLVYGSSLLRHLTFSDAASCNASFFEEQLVC